MISSTAKFFFQIATFSRKIGKNLLPKDRKWYAQLQEWQRLDGDGQLRIDYGDLGSDPVVFDLGGYKGQWASDIFSKYLCNVHVFEPHPAFAAAISKRFEKNARIRVYDFGLGSKDEAITLTTSADATSVFKQGGKSVPARIKCAEAFLEEHGIETIDLMKINIEGGEYDLLNHLIATEWIKKIKNIQVQFHHFVPDAENLMQDLQKELGKTHDPTYQFKFLWENWKLR